MFGFVEVSRPFAKTAILEANDATVCMHEEVEGTRPAPGTADGPPLRAGLGATLGTLRRDRVQAFAHVHARAPGMSGILCGAGLALPEAWAFFSSAPS